VDLRVPDLGLRTGLAAAGLLMQPRSCGVHRASLTENGIFDDHVTTTRTQSPPDIGNDEPVDVDYIQDATHHQARARRHYFGRGKGRR
jgi:hypothetical protein